MKPKLFHAEDCRYWYFYIFSFHFAGPNSLNPWKSGDSELADLPNKLLLYYTPKVSRNIFFTPVCNV